MKKSYWIILGIMILIVEVVFVSISFIRDDNTEIPDRYIAVFKGESGETVHSTYVYKEIKKNKTIYKYMNTVSRVNGYDSSAWQEKITKQGKLKKKKKIYDIAKKNEAYDYVKYEDGKIYSIEEFKKMFR